MSKIRTFVTAAAASAAILLAGCTAMPTEQASVLDDRPQISFKSTLDNTDLPVYVDGLKVGIMSDFMEGDAALRVLPGTHTITVKMPNGKQNVQRIFVNDGVSKTIVIQ